MDIVWDQGKARKLRESRGISMEDVAQLILEGKYIDILGNPSHPGQMLFVLRYKGYTHVVPFIVDDAKNVVLKTVYPSRKFHRLYDEE
jgi:uncharacterized DUF497 family protein